MMNQLFELFGLGTFFVPALVISGIVYKLFMWAQTRLPLVSDYARSWLLGTIKPVALASSSLEIGGMTANGSGSF